jgi:hypothetical protein
MQRKCSSKSSRESSRKRRRQRLRMAVAVEGGVGDRHVLRGKGEEGGKETAGERKRRDLTMIT